MSNDLNKFSMNAEKGQLAFRMGENSLPARVLSSSVNNFYGGTGVKLVDSTEKELIVEKAGVTDQILGFVEYSVKKNLRVAGDRCDVSIEGNVMFLEAGGAFNLGAELEYNPTGDLVIIAGGTNTKIGIALRKSTGSGDIIPVLLKTPSLT